MKTNPLGFTLRDVLFILGMQERTGELAIESGNNIGTILMFRGKILQAFSPYSRAIGDLLVEDGLITDTELMETLKLQKHSTYAPLGSLLLKTGKVTFEVIEMMVHEQIRQSLKEFQSWKDLSLTFLDKDIHPYDRIQLATHEFIGPEILQSARSFLSVDVTQQEPPSAATTSRM